MTDEPPSGGDRDPGPGRGLVGVIRQVLDALIDAERSGGREIRGTGRRPGRRYSIEYGFSGHIGGLGGESDTPGLPRESLERGKTATADEPYLVDIREADDAVLVVADLPDVDIDDLTVGLADRRSALVIRVGGEPLERIELPWPVDEVEPRLHHGVLEIRITPAEGTHE